MQTGVPLKTQVWAKLVAGLQQAIEPPAVVPEVDALPDCLTTLQVTPQPKQRQMLDSTADITIMGGAAYGGKTFCLLLTALRHIKNAQFGATFFRRTYSRITVEGGMWDESQKLYRPLGAHPNASQLTWTWPSRAGANFAHLQHEGDEFAYYGAQICGLGFDQLEEFSSSQFFYMLGRNRSTCGVRPYCVATCNPDPDSWLASFLGWWIDEAGDPIPERAGQTRHFTRLADDSFVWADSAEALREAHGPDVFTKSVCFIPATMDDNPIGREKDPTYEANLMLQVGYLRQRLRFGNWKARPSAGQFFQRQWFPIVEAAPPDCRWVRCWDRASTEVSAANRDPDWTAGVKLGVDGRGYYYVGDVARLRGTPRAVEEAILTTAAADGVECPVALLKDPAQAGKMEVEYLVRQLAGYVTVIVPQTARKSGSTESAKEIAARPVASQAQSHHLSLVHGRWIEAFLLELENFPGGVHDDQVDALSGAFSVLAKPTRRWLPVDEDVVDATEAHA